MSIAVIISLVGVHKEKDSLRGLQVLEGPGSNPTLVDDGMHSHREHSHFLTPVFDVA
jgi:hypothetical protein